MGGSIREIVLSLVLSETLPRKRLLDLLRNMDAHGPRNGVPHLFADQASWSADESDEMHRRLPEARKLLAELARQKIEVTCLVDSTYPRLLKEIHDPPAVLFHQGTLPDDGKGAVAVVGSRKASFGGIRFAIHLAEELAQAGFIVVSGLARGIDTAAHRGALEAGGDTIAVLGCGLDVMYPPENHALAHAIAGSGAVVTELLPGDAPLRRNFPRRNRIISGLSLGTVVVEAGERSGALITAGYAIEQNRSVFAVPGTPGFYGSKGTNSLLRQGAKLVECVDDVLEEVAPQVERSGSRPPTNRLAPPVSGVEQKVLELLSAVPVHVDELSRSLEMTSRDVVNILFSLETRGLARSMPGKFFVREGTL